MATIHNKAKFGEIAKLVLMPGDPLRAKNLAHKYLLDAKLVNDIRGMYAYTGEYRKIRVTIMASGMGCGSMGLYSHELYNKYDCDCIIRTGSCASYTNKLHLHELFIPNACYSQSAYARIYSGSNLEVEEPDIDVYNALNHSSCIHKVPYQNGVLHTTDCFYTKVREDHVKLNQERGLLGVDMESFALFHNARIAKKKAGTILTVSDCVLTKEKLNADERQRNFDQMAQVALDALVHLV